MEETTSFMAGAATSNITPPLGVDLSGAISQVGPATHVHDELHARALALDDGRERLALVVCDSTMIAREVIDKAKQRIQESTGLPPDRVLVSATHSHSVPRAMGIGQGELDHWYLDFLSLRIADSVCRALNHLSPARIGWGVGAKPEFVHNRRWYMRSGAIPPNPFGEQDDAVQMNPPRPSENLIKPAGPVDPAISILSVQHRDGRPLALFANYGPHYAGGIPQGHISADYHGVFSERVKELVGMGRQDPPFVAAMSAGACGDVNTINFRQPTAPRPLYSKMEEMGFALADEALRITAEIDYQDHASVNMKESELELKVRRPNKERIAWAKSVWNERENQEGLKYPDIYAREALLLADYPATAALKLQAIRIGDAGLMACPCEVFAETGLALKEKSPLKPAIVIELANGAGGYLPSPAQHELGGYETWPARTSFLEVEAEPKIRAELLRLLEMVS